MSRSLHSYSRSTPASSFQKRAVVHQPGQGKHPRQIARGDEGRGIGYGRDKTFEYVATLTVWDDIAPVSPLGLAEEGRRAAE